MGDAVRQATSTMGQKEAILNIDHKKARASSLLVFASRHGALFQRQCEVRIVRHWTCCLVHGATARNKRVFAPLLALPKVVYIKTIYFQFLKYKALNKKTNT